MEFPGTAPLALDFLPCDLNHRTTQTAASSSCCAAEQTISTSLDFGLLFGESSSASLNAKIVNEGPNSLVIQKRLLNAFLYCDDPVQKQVLQVVQNAARDLENLEERLSLMHAALLDSGFKGTVSSFEGTFQVDPPSPTDRPACKTFPS
ncbi:hypothetical protein CYMTET_52353 [Cymbomonas tetramitiformis]|uniref:Uncharacterized protein n=1 Tax=Cymbomonas tetramitiformis TaxID=36881 RepID=A0AAE0BKC6_9CHLO|nr:hypothetical protein CYMTET_52353 [Cymbomonas tetramitiformis]